ncbi:MAG TPA: hypothetical protein IGR64_04705 [Leptolyngbyaceae cyanobacterium M65_K2018_010]|nr:hypothetical protein [Leptolyngbyaceae cyanobacterium M65_K2018_010]
MEYWEFLLQQEGDQSWLPLDTAQVEILEGRYRIMAHTSQTNIPVQVQISQRLLDQDPPKRRTLRRHGQTNEEGLMVVMPFTRLGAGTWDIHCLGPAPEAATGPVPQPAWAYSIQLQVLPVGSGEEEGWFADEGLAQSETLSEAVGDRAAGAGSPPIEEARAAWSHLDLSQLGAALDRVQTSPDRGGQASVYRLSLNQTALSGQEGDLVGLSGQVTGVVEGESCADMALVVRLIDPQTAQVVTLQPFSLGASTLPAHFNGSLSIPGELSTRLLLGELALVSLALETVNVLALQRFTVTVDLAALFDAIANRAETEADLDRDFLGEAEEEGLAAAADLDAGADPRAEAWAQVTLPSGPPRVVPMMTLPRSGFNLPPKIYYPSPHEAQAHRPTLPPLSTTGPSPGRPDLPFADGMPTDGTPGDGATGDQPPRDEATEVAPPRRGDPFPPLLSTPPRRPKPKPEEPEAAPEPALEAPAQPPDPHHPPLSLPPLARPASPAEDTATAGAGSPSPTLAGAAKPRRSSPKPIALLPSHEAMGFRDLKLQDRFWSRLNDLAVTLQQEALQRRAEEAAAAARSWAEAQAAATAVEEIPAEPIPFAGEVVIYEDEDETLGSWPPPPKAVGDEDAAAEVIAPPVPLIELPGGELVAGESVLVTLRVPFHPNRLYIKVWITDPQTRSLVDEPRQVMHLSPNGHGQLEGTIQLTVPLGCLEAQFEAIAVDMVNQQESYKATVHSPITPAGVTTPGLDDLDL